MGQRKSPEHRTQEIKRLLYEKGGVVVAPRRSGKTQALVEILYENRNAVVVVGNSEMIAHIESRYRDQYDDTLAIGRVLLDRVASMNFRGREITDVFVDEHYWSEYQGPFKAAVTSLPDDFVGAVPELFVFESKPADLGGLAMNSKVVCYGYDREGTYHRGTEGVFVEHSINTDLCVVSDTLTYKEYKLHISQLKPK